MSGFGEFLGILQVVQFGFSLASQLKSLYDDFREAGDDIVALANNLTVICGNVQELQQLLDKDVTTKGFTPSGRLSAQDCCIQTARLTGKLWKLVRKSGKEELLQGQLVSANDIDFGKFRAHWTLLKPDVEKHVAELRYLDLRILVVKKEYNPPGASAAEKMQAAQEREGLNKMKRKAWQDLRSIKERHREEKQAGKRIGRPSKVVQISDLPPSERTRTPSVNSSALPSDAGNAIGDQAASPAPSERTRTPSVNSSAFPSDAGNAIGDQAASPAPSEPPVYDAEGTQPESFIDGESETSQSDGMWITEAILSEILDRIEPTLRDTISVQMEDEKRAEAEDEAKRKADRETAIAEYKRLLIQELQKSDREADELRKELAAAFAGNVDHTAIVKFVQAKQIATIKNNQVAELLADLARKRPEDVKAAASEAATENSEQQKPGGLFRRWFNRLAKSKPVVESEVEATTSYDPARSESPNRNSRSVWDGQSSTLLPDDKMRIHSVVISTDGNYRQANRVQLSPKWINALMKAGDKRAFWKTPTFTKSLRTYARLDPEARHSAENWPRQGIESDNLTLLFAKRFDDNLNRRRRFLDATLLYSEPWEFFHGRVLLVYKVELKDDKPEDPRSDDRYAWYRRRRSADSRSRSRSRSRSPSPPRGDVLFTDDPKQSQPAPQWGPPSGELQEGDDQKQGSSMLYPRHVRGPDGKLQEVGIGEAYVAGERSRSHSRPNPTIEIFDDGPHDAPDVTISKARRKKSRGSFDDYEAGLSGPSQQDQLTHNRRPTYIKIHRKYLELESLQYYDLPWEFDYRDPNYIVILQEPDTYQTDVLFEHSRRVKKRDKRSRSKSSSRTHSNFPSSDRYETPLRGDSFDQYAWSQYGHGGYDPPYDGERASNHQHRSRSRSYDEKMGSLHQSGVKASRSANPHVSQRSKTPYYEYSETEDRANPLKREIRELEIEKEELLRQSRIQLERNRSRERRAEEEYKRSLLVDDGIRVRAMDEGHVTDGPAAEFRARSHSKSRSQSRAPSRSSTIDSSAPHRDRSTSRMSSKSVGPHFSAPEQTEIGSIIEGALQRFHRKQTKSTDRKAVKQKDEEPAQPAKTKSTEPLDNERPIKSILKQAGAGKDETDESESDMFLSDTDEEEFDDEDAHAHVLHDGLEGGEGKARAKTFPDMERAMTESPVPFDHPPNPERRDTTRSFDSSISGRSGDEHGPHNIHEHGYIKPYLENISESRSRASNHSDTPSATRSAHHSEADSVSDGLISVGIDSDTERQGADEDMLARVPGDDIVEVEEEMSETGEPRTADFGGR